MNSPGANSILEPDNEPDHAPDTHQPSWLASSRARFWLGFGISFLLLMLFSCGGSFLLFGPENFSLADLQGGQGDWTPPTAQPTTAPSEIAETADELTPQETAGLFYAGQQTQNVTNSQVNLRTTPGYQGKPTGDVLAQLRPGDGVEILGQSAPGDGLIWWQVRYQHPDGRTIEGWIAQATASGVTILAAVE